MAISAPATLPVLVGQIILSAFAGWDSRRIVEQLSADDRARLEEQFGDINVFIDTLLNLPELAGIPDIGIGGLPGAGFGQGEAALGQGAIFSTPGGTQFTGTITQGPSGRLFFTESGTNDPFRAQLDVGEGGTFTASGFPGATIGVSDPQAFQNFLGGIVVPETPSVLGGVNIPQFGAESTLGRIIDFSGGFLTPGGLERVTAEQLTPELPDFDADALRADLLGGLRSSVQETASSSQRRTSQALVQSGILPGSATFQQGVNIDPQLQAAESLSRGTVDINADVAAQETEFGFKRANIEATAAQAAAQINAQLTATEQGAISGQRSIIADQFRAEADVGLAGAGLQISANEVDINNDFRAFGAELGLGQFAFTMFESFLASRTNLTIQGKALAADLIKSMLLAELAQTDATILSADILNNILQNVGFIFEGLLSAQKPFGLGGGQLEFNAFGVEGRF